MERERIQNNDLVRHFKYETLTEDEKAKGMCTYQVIEINARHTELAVRLVVYQSIYDTKVYVRPYNIFMSEVDHDKYPNIKQRYRFENINENCITYKDEEEENTFMSPEGLNDR